MSSEQIPLGKKEGQRLEFKGRDALQNRFKIGREVVGMLNAEGGDIWIGLAEEAGRAVRVEGIEKPEVEKRALRDFLVDTVEPPLSSGEFEIRTVTDAQGGTVLKIHVQPKENRRPYALLKKNLRDYAVRIDERLRTMDHTEIHQATSASDTDRQAEERLKTLKEKNRTPLWPRGTFQIRFQPINDMAIEIQDDIFQEILLDPRLTGNRRVGGHFARASHQPRLAQGKVCWSDFQNALQAEIQSDGSMRFAATLELFHWKGGPRELWANALLEFPVSAFRIASFLYSRFAPELETRVAVACALLGLQGWSLRPYAPDNLRSLARIQEYGEQDFEWGHIYDASDIREEPDRCGFRLVRKIYEAFGYREDEMPRYFEPETGRLVLPE